MRITKPVVAIVAAAGSGSRLGASVPKALVSLGGRPLVWRALEALRAGGVEKSVVAVPEEMLLDFAGALKGCPARYELITGGATRQDSVRLGLEKLNKQDKPADIVLVHDAARPLVPPEVIHRVVDAIRRGMKVAVPVIPVADTIRQIFSAESRVIDRSALRAVQTPQAFDRETLTRAHSRDDMAGFTDDAAMCERLGLHVELVEGSPLAHKITEPADLVWAEAMLRTK